MDVVYPVADLYCPGCFQYQLDLVCLFQESRKNCLVGDVLKFGALFDQDIWFSFTHMFFQFNVQGFYLCQLKQKLQLSTFKVFSKCS